MLTRIYTELDWVDYFLFRYLYIASARTALKTPRPRILLFVCDMLIWLLSGNGPDIVDAVTCFDCCGNVFAGRCLRMDDFSASAVRIFRRYVKMYKKIYEIKT
jgi:hypothetical protein